MNKEQRVERDNDDEIVRVVDACKDIVSRSKKVFQGNGEHIEYLGLKTIPSFHTLY